MLRKVLQVTFKASAILVASSVFVAAHATAPRLTAAELASCADNNPWVKSGYCERNDAWDKSRCLCPHPENSGNGAPDQVASTDDRCDIKKVRTEFTLRTFSSFNKPTFVHFK